jgi:membrane-associated phospholipid phosphatase
MEIIWLSAYYIYSIGGYYLLSHRDTARQFLTPWDKYIPTVPVFVIPYLLATILYTAFPIYLFTKLGWDKTKPFLVVATIANSIAFLFYAFWNTSVAREPIKGTDMFSNILKQIYATDRPTAAFPSGHVYMTLITGYFCWIYFPASRPYVIILSLLVMMATVLLKQHYLPDILGGILVALVSIAAVKYLKLI